MAGLHLGAVLEVVAEPVLEGDQPVVVGGRAGGDLGGGVVHVVGHVVGQSEEDLVGRVVGGGRPQLVGREVGGDGHDRELLARHQVGHGFSERAGVGVDPHVVVGCHLVDVGGGRHDLVGQGQDLELLADRAARAVRAPVSSTRSRLRLGSRNVRPSNSGSVVSRQ